MKKKLNILVLSPHADDAEIAMGGTIAKYVDEGHNVTIMTAILPKENKEGQIDDFMSKNRVKEQENSAKILGAKLDVLDLDPYDFSFSIFSYFILNYNNIFTSLNIQTILYKIYII